MGKTVLDGIRMNQIRFKMSWRKKEKERKSVHNVCKLKSKQPVVLAHAYNPSTQEAEVRELL